MDDRSSFEAWAKRENQMLHVFSLAKTWNHPHGERYIELATELCFLSWQSALASREPTLKNNEFIPDSTEGRIQAAIKCLNMHWVSHDANRFDYAIEGLEKCLAALASQAQQEPSKDIHEAITLLSAVFDAWENGTDCYDDFDGVSGSFIGKAFNLDDEIFKRCCDLLNRVNPPRNVSQAQQTESKWISVDERLPEGYKPVLVVTNFGDVYTCRLPVIIAKNSKEESSVGKRERFTYWMPLPPAPEGGDK